MSLLLLVLAVPAILPVAYLSAQGVSRSSLDWVHRYLVSLPERPGYWLQALRLWLLQGFLAGHPSPALLLPPSLMLAFLVAALALNPFSAVDRVHGDARWAGAADVRRMGLLRGFVIVLGRWRRRRLKLPETLSVLCIAPPGTGKTAAVVVPSILDGDGLSMVVNDIKPELFRITSGHRSRLGPVLRLDWAASDAPDAPPPLCWNPLSASSLPAQSQARDLAIDRLAAILIADPQGGADPHWSRRARAALSGLTHFIIDKVAADNRDGLPARWHGAEACFPMLLDWLTEASLTAAAADQQARLNDSAAAFTADPMRDVLLAAVAEATSSGYAHRAVLELTQLANTPDRERGSILSTLDSGLAIFKNLAVRERTCRSDFCFADLRGYPDPRNGRFHPVTVYLCVTQQDAKALSVMTGLFVEALSAYLIAHPPGAVAALGGRVGPYPTLFVLDEFPQMPKLQALIDGPALGRGQKVSYLLVGQDFAQIEEKYGKTGLETLLSTTAAKILLPLNNERVAKRFSDMIGSFTYQAQSKSRTYGLSRQADPFAVNVSKSLSAVPLVQPSDLMSLPSARQILIVQSFANRPLRLVSPAYYQDAYLRRRAYDPRTGKGPAPIASGFRRRAEQFERGGDRGPQLGPSGTADPEHQ